jgi:predicted nucleic acid-binding protein
VATERYAVGLLDASVVIDLGRLDPSSLPTRSHVSAITLAELGLGVHTTADPSERAHRADRLQQVEATFDPLPFTAEGARRFAHLAGLVVASGRSPKPRRLDLMIAAVACANDLPLYTRNPDDFRGTESILTAIAV